MNNNYVLLNNAEHQNLKVITDHAAEYGDNVNFVLTFPVEFRQVQSCYPIFIRKDANTGEFAPVALFGFENGENLFLDDNDWSASYVPLMIRRHPFIIGFQQSQGETEEKKAMVSIDLSSPRVNENEGEALFLEHGGISDYLSSVMEMLETIRLANEMNQGFIKALADLELLEAVTMQVELENGSKHELLGYYTINEERLKQLDGEQLEMLNSEHYLESIYMIIASLSCFRNLIDRKNARVKDAT